MSEAEEITQEIATRIRRYRHSKGWSQERLAREMDMTWKTVSRAENGTGVPLTTLARFGSALGVSVRELLGLPPSLRERDSNSQPTGLQFLPVPEEPSYLDDSSPSVVLPIPIEAA